MTALLSYAHLLLERLLEKGTAYQKAGVILDSLEPPGTGQQLDLFAADPAVKLIDNRALDALNQRFGRGTVQVATEVPAHVYAVAT
ncbi:DUF4113 domain-containing protein [Hymenobacter norwichensis]|uniref:DUF4113 domain-containing protein n=1 Tax=Hymenobacter norwichensis TaxID=223903 RepID=UPI0003B53A51|nr:DUF4113 domain-containing protein [Hymenobacter norwichensis]